MKAQRFTQDQMHAAFTEVEAKTHWKDPVDCVIPKPSLEKQALLEEAIVHFTGSIPIITDIGNNQVRVRADGYYAMENAMYIGDYNR